MILSITLDRTDKMLKASQFDPKAKVSMRGEPLAGTESAKSTDL